MFLAWTFWKQQSYLATSKTGGNFLEIFLARLADTLSVQIKDWKGTHGSLIWAWLCCALGRDQNSLSAIPGHQLGPAECSPRTVSFIMQEFLFTWKGIIVSSLPESVSCVCTATGVFTSLYLRCPCVMQRPVTPVPLWPLFTPLVSLCLFLHSWSWGTKPGANANARACSSSQKTKNQCCQVSRTDRESRGCSERVTSSRKLLVTHRTATIRWLKNLLTRIHICVGFIVLYKPWEAF